MPIWGSSVPRRRRCSATNPSWPIASRALVEALVVVTGVVDEPRGHPVRDVLRTDQVLAADVDAGHPQPGGRVVEHRLHREHGGRAGDAAVRAGRRGVGGDTAHRAAVVLQPVRPGEQPARHQRLDAGGPRVHRVRADVAGDVRVEGEQRAVLGEAGSEPVAVVAGVGGREQVLGPVLDPLHRDPGHRPRDQAERDVLGIEHRLDTEPAADVRRDHPDVALGQLQQLGDHVADEVRHLGAVPERQPAVCRLPQRDACAALHRVAAVPVGHQLPLDDERGAGQGGLDVTGAERPLQQHVVRRVVVQSGRGFGPGADRRRQGVVVGLDQLDAVLGPVAVRARRRRPRARPRSGPSRAPEPAGRSRRRTAGPTSPGAGRARSPHR